jgi:hypothetical protein
LLGLRAAMEEDEVERILGTDPVHMTEDGFVTLAENLVRTLDNPANSTVSGTGARRDNRVQQTRVTGPVSLPSLVPMSSGARNSTSGGYPGAGNGRWSTNY